MNGLNIIDQGSGFPILWIHGFPLSSLIFEPQLSIAGARHFVPDLPGFGDSGTAAIETIEDYAATVVAAAESSGISRAVVAGVSMGGYVAFSVVRQKPDLVAGLVLIDTRETPDPPEARENRRRQAARVDEEGARFLIDDMLPKMLTAPTLALNDRRGEVVRLAMESASPAGVKCALGAMASRSDSADVIRGFDGPVLVTVGEEDAITPPSDAERMVSLARNATLVRIPEAAHLSHVERPDVFNAAVASFLERVR